MQTGILGQLSFLVLASLLITASTKASIETDTPILGGPCEGCKLVFDDLPDLDSLPSHVRIAPEDEPGEPLVIEGTVRTPGGEPAPGIIVYAYHTDKEGIYPKAGNRHGRLRAWARTDLEGNYRFDTIRPASYPNSTIPQHVHMHVIEPGTGTYYIDDLLFADDPLLTERLRKQMLRGRGGEGLAVPKKLGDSRANTWYARRDIVLGENVPGYPRNQ